MDVRPDFPGAPRLLEGRHIAGTPGQLLLVEGRGGVRCSEDGPMREKGIHKMAELLLECL